MKHWIRYLLVSTLLIGTSAVLLRYWIGIYQYETVPVYEPNLWIRGAETVLWVGILVFAIFSFISAIRGASR